MKQGITAGNDICCPDHGHGKGSFMAILTGALIAVGLSFLLNLFSVAIGLTIVNNANPSSTQLAVGGFVGMLIGTIAAMFVSGFAAGCLGKSCCYKHNSGCLYGFTAWCLALLLMAAFAGMIGHYATMYQSFMMKPVYMITSVTESPIATSNLPTSSFLVFTLFFVGALAATFGGHFGMAAKMKNCDVMCK